MATQELSVKEKLESLYALQQIDSKLAENQLLSSSFTIDSKK